MSDTAQGNCHQRDRSSSANSRRGRAAPLARTLNSSGSATLDSFIGALEHGLPCPKRKVVKTSSPFSSGPSPLPASSHRSDSMSPPEIRSRPSSRRDSEASVAESPREHDIMATPTVSRSNKKRVKAVPTWSGGSTPALTPHQKSLGITTAHMEGVAREGSSSPESAFGVPTPERGFNFSPPAGVKHPSEPVYYNVATPQKAPATSMSMISPQSGLPFYALSMSSNPMVNMGMIPMGMSTGMTPPSAIHHFNASGSPFKRLPADKDGDVWPPDLQTAFDAALRIVPRLGRRKILVHTATGAKPYGRNELIADYIRRQTGQLRSRKQVSSHIQVLKNVHKNNYSWMRLVGEPDEGDPDSFSDAQATQFGGHMVAGVLHMLHGEVLPSPEASPITMRRTSSSAAGIPLPLYHQPIDLQSGYLAASHHAMLRSLSTSSTSSPGLETTGVNPFDGMTAIDGFGALNPAVGLLGNFGAGEPMSRTESLASLSGGLQAMEVRSATGTGSTSPTSDISSYSDKMTCGKISALPMAPTSFMMWATNQGGAADEDGDVEEQFVFATLNEGEDNGATVFLEDVDFNPDRRFPGLIQALTCLTCPMVHAKLALRLPGLESECNADVSAIQSQLNITTEIPPLDDGLAVITTVFSDGRAELSFPPISLGQPSKVGESRWMYSTVLPNAFLGQLLKGENTGSNAIFQQSMAGVRSVKNALAETTILQEFVVKNRHSSMVQAAGHAATRGCHEGEVVLMIAYELCVANEEGAGKVTLSHLSTRMRRCTPPSGAAMLDVLQDFAQPSGADLTPTVNGSVTSFVGTAPMLTNSQSEGQVAKPTRKRKTLSISIPAPPMMFGMPGALNADGVMTGGLRTPSFQIVHTPTVAPGAPGPGDAASVRRLQQSWAAAAGSQALHSPALYGPGMYPHLAPQMAPSPTDDVHDTATFDGILGARLEGHGDGYLQAPSLYGGHAYGGPAATSNAALNHMYALTASAHSPTGSMPSLGPHGPSTPFSLHPPSLGSATSLPDGMMPAPQSMYHNNGGTQPYWYGPGGGVGGSGMAHPIATGDGFFQGLWPEA